MRNNPLLPRFPFQRSPGVDVEDGRGDLGERVDALDSLHDLKSLLGLLPTLGIVGKDKEGVGNEVQLLGPLQKAVGSLQIELFADDLSANPSGASLNTEESQLETGCSHLLQQRLLYGIDTELVTEADVPSPFENPVHDFVQPCGVVVQGIVVEPEELRPVLVHQVFHLLEDPFRGVPPNLPSPIDGSRTKIAGEGTAPGGHEVLSPQGLSVPGVYVEAVLLHRNLMARRKGKGVQIFDRRAVSREENMSLLPVDDSSDLSEVPSSLKGLHEFDDRLLSLSDAENVRLWTVEESLLHGHRDVGPSQNGNHLGVYFFDNPRKTEGVEAVLRGGRDSDDFRFETLNSLHNPFLIEFKNIRGDNIHVVALLFKDSGKEENPQGGHRAPLRPPLRDIPMGGHKQLYSHRNLTGYCNTEPPTSALLDFPPLFGYLFSVVFQKRRGLWPKE
ncbi:MAG: hypothetical protein BWY86_00525 [Candidatus Aminicenantes bacterium ADurb.Bin508]|nr:MAG: hypothetical protein BWY86_00525 [Candidatus Aminicenantes bacterium ADurb.Bin508]